MIDIQRELIALGEYFLNSLHSLVHEGCAFEVHIGTELLARILGGSSQRLPSAPQELRDALRFTAILVDTHCLLAWTQTSPHLAIDAAGVVRPRFQILLTS